VSHEGRSVGLLFVDGHEDGYLPAQSPTGETADMELAFALGVAEASWSDELAVLLPVLAPADVWLLGPRDAEALREEGVASLGGRVPLVDGNALLRDPVGGTMRASSSLPRPWWFHIDLDVLSTDALPAVDYPQPGGLDWDALRLLARAAMSHDPVGLDLTIYNPDLDPEGEHALRIVEFLARAFAPT
jgi:arginase